MFALQKLVATYLSKMSALHESMLARHSATQLKGSGRAIGGCLWQGPLMISLVPCQLGTHHHQLSVSDLSISQKQFCGNWPAVFPCIGWNSSQGHLGSLVTCHKQKATCLTMWYRYRPAKLKIGEFEIHSIALQCIYGQDWTEICSRTHFTNVTQGFQQPFACLMLERDRLTQNLLGKTMLSEKKNDQYRKHGFESVSIFLWPLWPHNSHLVQLQWVVSCQVEKLSSQT